MGLNVPEDVHAGAATVNEDGTRRFALDKGGAVETFCSSCLQQAYGPGYTQKRKKLNPRVKTGYVI